MLLQSLRRGEVQPLRKSSKSMLSKLEDAFVISPSKLSVSYFYAEQQIFFAGIADYEPNVFVFLGFRLVTANQFYIKIN